MAAASDTSALASAAIGTRRGGELRFSVDEIVTVVGDVFDNLQTMPDIGTDAKEPSFPAVTKQPGANGHSKKYDIFLSHLQRNGQDAIISMRMFLKQEQPGLRTFVDLEVDMKGDLQKTLREAVMSCTAFLFFVTDGILESKWCAQELRWAVEFGKHIILVRETDARHGGLEMKDFLLQVPEDLMHVFQNIIAIPWYREPAFRAISIRSILAAANVEDTYARDMEDLAKTRDKLEALVDVSGVSITAFDVIQQYSFCMKLVMFLGGFQMYKSRNLNMIYTCVFGISFWVCAIICITNLIYQVTPFHVISSEFVAGYMHIPAWHGWLKWRKFITSPHCCQLLTKITAKEQHTAKIAVVCKYSGYVILFLQVAMILIVLGGFPLPYSLGHGKEFGNDIPGKDGFILAHTYIMYAAIPAAIASMIASYSMFGFVALLHLLDVQILKEMLGDCANVVARFNSRTTRRPSRPRSEPGESEAGDLMTSVVSGGSVRSGMSSHDLEQKQRKQHMEEKLYEVVLGIIEMLTSHTQRRIDGTCAWMSSLWVHLVVFSILQVLAVANGFISHVVGNLNLEYTWWWGLQDFFLLGGGIVLLLTALGLFCAVTTSFESAAAEARSLFKQARCPMVRQLQVIGCINSRKCGMHAFWGVIFIGRQQVICFLFVLTVFFVDYAFQIANTLDRGSLN